MIDKYDETLVVLFLGYLMKHTMVFKQKNSQNTVKFVTHLTVF